MGRRRSWYLLQQLDGSEDDRSLTHLPGVDMLDTTTLCGYTWPVVRGPDVGAPTCRSCLRTLAELRETLPRYRRISTDEGSE